VVRIALGDPSHVPAGRYAREALEAVALWEKLQEKLVLGMNVRQVRDYVARGEVDAGIVFASDANIPGVRIDAVIPADLHTPIRYPAAVLRLARNPEGATAFLEFLISKKGQRILESSGFEPVEAAGEPVQRD
jgi:molybdate transport system substrate-binding protein